MSWVSEIIDSNPTLPGNAGLMGGKNKDPKTGELQTEQQKMLGNLLLPYVGSMFGYNMELDPNDPTGRTPTLAGGPDSYGQVPNLWDVPDTPGTPGMPTLSGQLPTGYDIPSNQNLMPTSDWYSSLSPDVMQGLRAPWDEAADQMLEKLGGNTRGGYSGATGAALGEHYSNMATQVPLQAWQMTQPGMQAGWQAELARNQYGANQQTMGVMADYETEVGRRYSGLEGQREQWRQQIAANQAVPSFLAGMYGQTMATPWIEPARPDPTMQTLGNIGGGALSGTMMGGWPWGTLAGAGAGAFSSAQYYQ